MTPSLILVIDQAIRLLVVVLVAVAKEQRVVARLAACVVRAQASGVKLVIGRQAWRVRRPRVGAREHNGAKHGTSPVEAPGRRLLPHYHIDSPTGRARREYLVNVVQGRSEAGDRRAMVQDCAR